MIGSAAIKTSLMIILFVCSSYLTFSQSYESSSQDVQNKMDQNKRQGIDLLQGINISYELYFFGVNSSSDSQALQELLISRIQATEFNYDPQSKTFAFKCNANIGLKQVKSALEGTNYEINRIYKAVYVLANY